MMVDKLLKAVSDCIVHFTKPQVEDSIIYCGYYDVPAAIDGFIVTQFSDTKRIGTNITDKKLLADTTFINRSLREYVVDIDFCHVDDLTARERAVRLEILCWSHYVADFFKNHDIDFLHTDDIIVSRHKDGNNRYFYRYSLSLHLSMWHTVQVIQDYFDKVDIGIENIDVHHKP